MHNICKHKIHTVVAQGLEMYIQTLPEGKCKNIKETINVSVICVAKPSKPKTTLQFLSVVLVITLKQDYKEFIIATRF